MLHRIDIIQGNIAAFEADAVVNAANKSLLGGGGVDGAIHYAAGPELLEECRTLGGCETGEAKITGGYKLPAKYVIHTPGPIWKGGDRNEDALLAASYRNCLALAAEHGVKTIAFPSISTGAYAFPVDRAASIALTTVRDVLAGGSSVERVTFVCYTRADLAAYRKAFSALVESR